MTDFSAFGVLRPIADAIAPTPLYAVGGAVRDALMGRLAAKPDFDVCAALTPEQLREKLAEHGIGVEFPHGGVASATISIGELRAEFTSFRRDFYAVGTGSHAPIGFEYVATPQQDALRRDFRCNAIYFEIGRSELVDPLDGCSDIAAKLLRTTRDAETVISEDPVRILRLARFASALGSSPDDAAACACRAHIDDIDALSPERKRHEWDGLMDGRYLAHGLRIAKEIGLLSKLFPALADCEGVAQPPAFHKYDALTHMFMTAEAAPRHLRLAALLHDIGKAEALRRDGNMHLHAQIGAELAQAELSALGYPRRETERVCRLIELHMFDINANARRNTLRKFIVDNAELIPDLCALMRADSVGTGIFCDNIRADRLEREYKFMKENHIPFCVRDLAIGGDRLAALGFEGREIADVLKRLFEECLFADAPNTEQALERRAKVIADRRRNAEKRREK